MDPNPIKHPAVLLARVRTAIEPSLQAKGFQFDERNKPPRPIFLYIDYSREGECFRLSWDRRDSEKFIGLVAELLFEPGGNVLIARTDFSDDSARWGRHAEIDARLDDFVQVVNAFVNKAEPRHDGT